MRRRRSPCLYDLKALAPLLVMVDLTKLPTGSWDSWQYVFAKQGNLSKTNQCFLISCMSIPLGLGLCLSSILVGQRAAHLFELSFSDPENIYQCLSHTPLAVTSLHHLLPSSQDLSNQGKSPCPKAMLKVTLLSPRRCHSPVCSAWV